MSRIRVISKGLGFFLIAAALIVLQWRFDIISYFTAESVHVLLSKVGFAAPFVYMLAMAAVVVISPIPSLPLDIAAGIFFGPILGTLYSVIGALAGAVASFLIARFFGKDLIQRLLHGHINFCTGCSNKILTKMVFLSRLIPAVSFDIVSYGAGLTAMSLGKFAAATFLGMIPLTFIYNYFGAVLVIRGWASALIAGIFVLSFLLVPRLIERYNFLGLRKYFGVHSEQESDGEPRH